MHEPPLIESAHFGDLLLAGTTLIDVRAPIEFGDGALPASANHPILDDDERAQVGTTHRVDGPDAATVLGHQLVSGVTKDQRIDAWTSVVQSESESVLYCARGGQRSKIACAWLRDRGVLVPRVVGGYKALRNYLLAELENVPASYTLSGWTGVGKTETIEALPSALDLEELANHRGSAFGRMLRGQPAQQTFENGLAIELMKFRQQGKQHLVMEDESRLIGRIHLPPSIMKTLQSSPILLQEAPVEERVQRIHQDYILSNWKEYESCDPVELNQYLVTEGLPSELASLEQPFATFASRLLTSLDAIRKRLGGARHATLRQEMIQALSEHIAGDSSRHRRWINELLVEYYDPMYTYQIKRKEDRIVFRGDKAAIVDWMQDKS